MGRAIRSIAVLLLAALAAAGAPRGTRVGVSIDGRKFSPIVVTLSRGDSIVWTNNDERDHMISADDGAFSSGKLKPGQTFEYRFNRTGTYGYSCTLHPREKGKVLVR